MEDGERIEAGREGRLEGVREGEIHPTNNAKKTELTNEAVSVCIQNSILEVLKCQIEFPTCRSERY